MQSSPSSHCSHLPAKQKWSPDYLLHKNAAPMFFENFENFENEWGLAQPKEITHTNDAVHSPLWALGFQEGARHRGATCFVKFPEHTVEESAEIWDFVARQLQAPTSPLRPQETG